MRPHRSKFPRRRHKMHIVKIIENHRAFHEKTVTWRRCVRPGCRYTERRVQDRRVMAMK